jgi:hypothetical protein
MPIDARMQKSPAQGVESNLITDLCPEVTSPVSQNIGAKNSYSLASKTFRHQMLKPRRFYIFTFCIRVSILLFLITCPHRATALAVPSLLPSEMIGETGLPSISGTFLRRSIDSSSMFQNKTQVDVVTVLMLLGEATIWKAIWGRSRSRRIHWTHFIYSISPGWAPLAGSLFAALNGSASPPNLIFDRIPEGSVDSNLFLTNLNSGATHSAQNTILQNIWQTWNRGPRENARRCSQNVEAFDLTREVGVIDVDVDSLNLERTVPLGLQLTCLSIQFGGSIIMFCLGLSSELLIVFTVAMLGQLLLLVAIIPPKKAWYKAVRGHRPAAIMLHKGRDSMGVLILRKVTQRGRQISLEELCWDSQSVESGFDTFVKTATAGTSFLFFIFQIILVGWMSSESRIYYLIFGLLGLVATTIEAAIQPNWSKAYALAFSGNPRCAPLKSSLMSAVAMLIAGQFPAAVETAKLLYPANARFTKSLQDLTAILDEIVCQECRQAIRNRPALEEIHRCLRMDSSKVPNECSAILAERAKEVDSKQLSDGLAAVCHFLCSLNSSTSQYTVETSNKILTAVRHVW